MKASSNGSSSRSSWLELVASERGSQAEPLGRCSSRRRARRRDSVLIRVSIVLFTFCVLSSVSAARAAGVALARPRRAGGLPKGAEAVDLSAMSMFAQGDKAVGMLHRRQGVSGDRSLEIEFSTPKSCETLNITFDPSQGTPPYTVLIAFGDLWPVIFQLPAEFSDPTLPLWLVQYDMPQFEYTETPDFLVSIADSSGRMANSSMFGKVQRPPAGETCTLFNGTTDFIFFNDAQQSECEPFHITWSRLDTQPGWTEPLSIFFLPEARPPIHVPVANASARNLNYTMNIKAPSALLMMMSDAGPNGGGVSGFNLIGRSEYSSQDCLKAPQLNQLPSPTTTITAKMRDFTTKVAALSTQNGVVVTATGTLSVKDGKQYTTHGFVGKVLGLGIGLGVGAALGAAVVLWLIWRRRQRRVSQWEVSDTVVSGLSSSQAPLDRKLLQHNGSQPRSRFFPQTSGLRASHVNSTHGSMHSFGSSAHDTNGLLLASPPGSPMELVRQRSYRPQSYSDQPPSADGTFPPMPTLSEFAEGDGTVHRSPFSNSAAISGHQRGNSSGQYETLPLGTSDGNGSVPRRLHSSIVQHSDAVLLMDDSLLETDEEAAAEGEGRVVELPPQYEAVPPRNQPAGPSGSSQSNVTGTCGSSYASTGQGQLISPQLSASSRTPAAPAAAPAGNAAYTALGEGEDEAVFWRSP